MGNFLRAGYFNRVVTVATFACVDIVRSNPVSPEAVGAANLKQKVLTPVKWIRDPEVFVNLYRPSRLNV